MARNRMIKVEFWDDEKLATISRDARLTFIALWNLSDDYGIVKGNSVWLKSRIFPYDEKLKLSEFESWLNELREIKVIYLFNGNHEKYYFIKNFLDHQKINRPSPSKNPSPPNNILEDSRRAHGGLTEDSMNEGKKDGNSLINRDKGNTHGGLMEGSPPKEKEKEKEKYKEKEKENSSELKNISEQQSPLIILIPLIDKTEYPIYQTDLFIWQKSYPAVDILQALRSIREWNLSNPTRQKTPSGIRKHITAWLDKDQNKGGNRFNPNTGSWQTDANLRAAKAFLERDENE